MFKQRTKLAHRVTSASSSPNVAAAASGSWAEPNRATPPPPQPQFYNPNAVAGLAPVPSPGPQQQVWQQTPVQQQQVPLQQYHSGQQWPQQPAAVKSPPQQNNNNTVYNNDPWNWGPQQQQQQYPVNDQQTQQWQAPSVTQQPQNTYPATQTNYPPQQYNQQQQDYNNQGYQHPGQNDTWNWSWNQGQDQAQDASWNWGSEDSSPSTEASSNGPPQNPEQQYQQQYPQQYTPQQPEQPAQQQQQQFPPQYQNYTQEQTPQEVNNTTQSYQHYNFTTQQNIEPQIIEQPDVNTVSQQLADVSLSNVKSPEPVENEVKNDDFPEDRRESNLSIDYSTGHRDSTVDYQQQSRRESTLSNDNQGRESTLSMDYPVSQRDSVDSSMNQREFVDVRGRESIDYQESRRESILSNEHHNNVTPDLIATEPPIQYEDNIISDNILIDDQSNILDVENTQQPPDLVTDFENREIIPPDTYSRSPYGAEYAQKSSRGSLVPTSSSLVAAASANMETVPDNIERPEDVPVQPSTPPPPPPPVSQHRVGVGQDDPSPWPSSIPPPENQEVTVPPPPSLLPPPPMRGGPPLRHRPTHSNSPPLPPPPSASSSVDPVSASDRNQFLETGQLSADIPLFSRRQTIPGESRQSPEPGALRVVPGTMEPDEPSPDSQRSETIGSDFGEQQNQPQRSITIGNTEVRTNAEGINNDPQTRQGSNIRTNAEGINNEPPSQQFQRTVTVGNDNNTELRTNAEGINNEPRSNITVTRTHAEGTNNPVIQIPIPRIPIIGNELTRTNAEGTNEDRRNRNTNPTILTPSLQSPRNSAFTEVRNAPPVTRAEAPRQSRSSAEGLNSQRSNVTSLRSSGEGDNVSLGSDIDDGEISDLENVSSGEIDKEDGELDESVEERKEEKKKSPLQAPRAVSAESTELLRPPSAGRRPRKERGGSEERRSAERARGKPPRPQEEGSRRRERESQPRTTRRAKQYDGDDSDSYHSERGTSERDERRKYRGGTRSPDRHKSSRRPHDYYRDRDREEYRERHRGDPRDYRHGYDRHYERERSRPSSRAGSERRDYESDHQDRASASGRSHRDQRERDGHRGPRDKPPTGMYYDSRYREYRRIDPRDPYYNRGGYDYYGRAYDPHYAARPPPTVAPQPVMQHPEYSSYTYAYFEELRRSNPAAYADWYRRYLATTAAVSSQPGPGSGTFDGFPEDEHNSRGSVHSGRSSINDEIRFQLHQQRGRSPALSLRDYPSSPYHHLHQNIPPLTSHAPASLPPTYPHAYTYYQGYQQPVATNQAGSAVNAMGEAPSSSPAPVQRLTPAKFSSAHAVARMCVQGRLLHVLPHYPKEGQIATVLIHDTTTLMEHDPLQAELKTFPGPLVKGTTHKNSVIQFCSQKIRSAQQDHNMYDRDSYILVWRLLILLLRQNGTVVGADIAELLLENQPSSTLSELTTESRSPSPRSHEEGDAQPVIKPHRMSEEQLTSNFRQFLLFGNTKEALDWAMKHGLWGHALFLASKMDARTYANVMTRFANGLPMNDPLQTLYQLMSGRQPAAVTSCADEKWGDWKPHLAMILSNPSQRPELDHRAITTLGDTLAGRGCLHASHFCYLLAQLEFGSFEQQPPAKLVLLGSPHTSLSFEQFASCEAIQCTEVYEYARRLADPTFYLPHFQAYKFLYSARLVEYGYPGEGLLYCEEIAGALIQHSGSGLVNPGLVEQLTSLADSLKQIDPLFTLPEGVGEEEGAQFYASDPPWLTQLRQLLLPASHINSLPVTPSHGPAADVGYITTEYTEQMSSLSLNESTTQDSVTYTDQQWQQYYYNQQQWEQQQQQQQTQQQTPEPTIATNEVSETVTDTSQQQPQSGYWPQQQQPWTPSEPPSVQQGEGTETQAETPDPSQGSQQQSFNYWDHSGQQNNDQSESLGNTPECDSPEPTPTITLAGTRRQKTLSESSTGSTNHRAPKASNAKPAKGLDPGQAGGGWLGGLWSKISLRPKNQMKLPDDKNPTIVWDAAKKRWVNTDGDEDEAAAELRPPPRAPTNHSAPPAPNDQSQPEQTQQTTPTSQSTPTSAPPSMGSGYKLGRGMRKNYVNVLQPNGTGSSPKTVPPPADMFPSSQPSAPVNFFIPAPVGDTDGVTAPEFVTPASSVPESPQSSEHEPTNQQAGGVPMMYNPAQFTASQNNYAYQR